MKKHHLAVIILAIGLAFMPFHGGALKAEPLQSATVIETHNEVTLEQNGARRDAVLNDVVQDKDSLMTGKKSRAELEFKDKSIARLGASTIFSFNPDSREMRVQQGTALIHVPPSLGGATISTPAATAAIQGDVVALRVYENGNTDIVSLSQDANGPIKVTFNKTGESLSLRPGQLLSINPLATKIPRPVTINVQAFTQGSGLLKKEANGGFKTELPLTARKEIQKGLAFQEKEVKSGILGKPGVLSIAKLPSTVAVANLVNEKAITTSSFKHFGGFFVGKTTFTQIGVAGIQTGIFSFEVFQHGFVEGTHKNLTTGKTGSFTGFIRRSGEFVFRGAGGDVFSGVIRLGEGNGSYQDSLKGIAGNFQVHHR